METNKAVELLGALAQQSRLAVFRLLVQAGPQGLPAGEIAQRLGLAPNTLSFHLKEMTRAGLLKHRQQGRFIIYAADFPAMNALLGFLTENCCAGDTCAAVPDTACQPTEGERS